MLQYDEIDPAVIEMTKAYPDYAPQELLACLTGEIVRQGRVSAKMTETPAQPILECDLEPIESVTALILSPSQEIDDQTARLVYSCKSNKRHEFPSQRILREVAEKHRFPNGVTRVTIADIKSHSRPRWLVRIRQEAMYRLATETALSFPKIGRIMGRRDHTTILYGYRQHAKRHGLPLRGEMEQ